MNANSFIIVIILFAIIATAIAFYNTIVTKKWRNKVPNEEEYWKLGFIYYNPTDSRIFLPKRTGLGYTLNFAKPLSTIIILAIVVFIALLIRFKIK
ncbi:MAG: DUF5808 domain-containing protein [Ignavibacteriaceae bacterium]